MLHDAKFAIGKIRPPVTWWPDFILRNSYFNKLPKVVMKFISRVFLPNFLIAVVALSVLMAGDVTAADDFPPTYVQAFVGAAEFDEEQMTFTEGSSNDVDGDSANDLSTMPFLGFGGQYAFSGQDTHFGLDGTVLFGWRSHDSSIAAGNGQARVNLDTSLWLVDLAMGIYGQTIFADNWRLYLAAGPMMLFGEYEEEIDDDDTEGVPTDTSEESYSDSVFGVGGYARVGLEYRLANAAFLGFCVRGIATNLEFDSSLDDGGLNGVQGFLTYSQPFR
jgi:hypothetical protein